MKIIQKAVPTNIITGFLGVGKSTAIRHLLTTKPEGETWAVLVNEFGEVGIDGSLLRESGDNKQLYIKEVPGGCMCCTSGLPMQIALNLLLAQSQPDRLLIEPTGLGHPLEILQSLSAAHYRGVLELRQTLTLVDARKVSDSRYTEHPIFRQQIEVADCLVANKADVCTEGDFASLAQLAQELGYQGEINRVVQGEVKLDWLVPKAQFQQRLFETAPADAEPAQALLETLQAPAQGVICRQRQSDGFYTFGWIFSLGSCFDFNGVMSFFMGLDVQRVKAILLTDKGWYVFNQADGVLSTNALSEGLDSRVECISEHACDVDSLQGALQSLIKPRSI
ncbi:GTP-binding protein [Lacimicrobium sp. SS2-24]|uniref:CobW family GTP-binding protein n=1 Tax=Lacimicrobium sp. SS2-24 TaxID=2005569 RepID=UPI001FEE7311|nr:GTP-binding protein [Lacimicrobium sp. SS2-24]